MPTQTGAVPTGIEAICLSDGKFKTVRKVSFAYETVRDFSRFYTNPEGLSFAETYAQRAHDFLAEKQASFPGRQIALPENSHPRLILEKACSEGFFPIDLGIEYARLKGTLNIVEQSFSYDAVLGCSGMGERDFVDKYYDRASRFLIRKLQAFPDRTIPRRYVVPEKNEDLTDAVKAAIGEGFYPIEEYQRAYEQKKGILAQYGKTEDGRMIVGIFHQIEFGKLTLGEYVERYSGIARRYIANLGLVDTVAPRFDDVEAVDLAIRRGFIPVDIRILL